MSRVTVGTTGQSTSKAVVGGWRMRFMVLE